MKEEKISKRPQTRNNRSEQPKISDDGKRAIICGW